MCPSSCSPTETATPTTNRSTPSVYVTAVMSAPYLVYLVVSPLPHRVPPRLVARPGVGGQHIVDRQGGLLREYGVGGEHTLQSRNDVREPHLTVEKRRHADLVRRVVQRRRRATAGTGLTGQFHGGGRLRVEREELPGLRRTPVHGRGCVRHPIRPSEPQRYRHEHRGR